MQGCPRFYHSANFCSMAFVKIDGNHDVKGLMPIENNRASVHHFSSIFPRMRSEISASSFLTFPFRTSVHSFLYG